MTNVELLAKIKAEIERRMKAYNESIEKYADKKKSMKAERDAWKWAECKSFLYFIDTLESEKPMNQDLEKELARFYLKDLCGLEKDEIPEATLHSNFPIMWDDLRDIARHFAKWGAEHLKK